MNFFACLDDDQFARKISANSARELQPPDAVYNWATFRRPFNPPTRSPAANPSPSTRDSVRPKREPASGTERKRETPGGERDGRRRRRGGEAGAAPGAGPQALPSVPPRRRRPLQGRPPRRSPRHREIRWYRAAAAPLPHPSSPDALLLV